MLRIKRAYDEPAENDGYRILIDRLWPRGISKEALQLDDWLKEVAPSEELRKWFDHDPDTFEQFREKYQKELSGKQELIDELVKIVNKQTVTLVYAAKDRKHNNAVVLKRYVDKTLK